MSIVADEQQSKSHKNKRSARKTKYSIPSKQLGFGSAGKGKLCGRYNTESKQSDKDDSTPVYFYEQAFLFIQKHESKINNLILRTVKIKHLQQEAQEAVLLDYIARILYITDFRDKSEREIIGCVLYKLKRWLISWVQKEQFIKKLNIYKDTNNEDIFSLTPLRTSRLIYYIAAERDVDGDALNRELGDILLDFLKKKVYAYEYEVYYLSYRVGLSDVEIAEKFHKDRSVITRIRNAVVQTIIHYKEEIELLFEEYLE